MKQIIAIYILCNRFFKKNQDFLVENSQQILEKRLVKVLNQKIDIDFDPKEYNEQVLFRLKNILHYDN